MRVCAPGADEDGFDMRVVVEVGGEGDAHGRVCVAIEGEVVMLRGGCDEVVNEGEGVAWVDVDTREGGGEVWVRGEEGEVEDQEDEAVFAAVVGEGEGGKSVAHQVSDGGKERAERAERRRRTHICPGLLGSRLGSGVSALGLPGVFPS